MINQQILQGHWNDIKGQIRSKWAQLTNDDLLNFDGNVERLIGLIQWKTGEGREAIERSLDELIDHGCSAFGEAAANFRQYAHQAGERIQERTRQAARGVRDGVETARESYEQAEEMVRRRPTEAAAVCFGAGVLAGLVVALLLHRK